MQWHCMNCISLSHMQKRYRWATLASFVFHGFSIEIFRVVSGGNSLELRMTSFLYELKRQKLKVPSYVTKRIPYFFVRLIVL